MLLIDKPYKEIDTKKSHTLIMRLITSEYFSAQYHTQFIHESIEFIMLYRIM